MAGSPLAAAYIEKAKVRLEVMELLMGREAFSDVVRVAQEVVELSTKAMLHAIGVDPPKWHDVGSLIVEYRASLPATVGSEADAIARISKRLRKEREFSFYGDIDFIPTEEYSADDAKDALNDATWVLRLAEQVVRA